MQVTITTPPLIFSKTTFEQLLIGSPFMWEVTNEDTKDFPTYAKLCYQGIKTAEDAWFSFRANTVWKLKGMNDFTDTVFVLKFKEVILEPVFESPAQS